jgi:hypothetical protein
MVSEAEEKKNGEQAASKPDDIDEDLLALSGPPPSLRYGLFTALIIVLSVAMLVWFFPDLHYLLQGFGEPEHLGEASDIDFSKLKSSTYASVDGIPWITKTIAFNEGVKWFSMSDTSRKLFPLTGQPRLFVQWTVPDEVKAYRDPKVNPSTPLLPGYFEGLLVRRDRYSKNYEKLWSFVERELKIKVGPDAWLLIDGKMPIDNIWVIPVYLIFMVMIVVNSLKFRNFLAAWRSQ